MDKSLTVISKECHEIAMSKGWWEPDENGHIRTEAESIALMHSELSEALEEVRNKTEFLYPGDGGKPEGRAVEYADVIIRIFDTCQKLGIPLIDALYLKMEYNKTRPHRHGGKLL